MDCCSSLVAMKTVEERDRQRQVIAEGELLTLPAIGVWVRSVRDSHVTDFYIEAR